jgi:hypothetical protein
MTIKASSTAPVPQSWDLKSWATQAAHVWPHNEDRARKVLRAHKAELHAYGH